MLLPPSKLSLSMDERRKKLQLELEAAQAGLNAMSKEIGLLMAKGDKAGADEKKKAVASVKSGHWALYSRPWM